MRMRSFSSQILLVVSSIFSRIFPISILSRNKKEQQVNVMTVSFAIDIILMYISTDVTRKPLKNCKMWALCQSTIPVFSWDRERSRQICYFWDSVALFSLFYFCLLFCFVLIISSLNSDPKSESSAQQFVRFHSFSPVPALLLHPSLSPARCTFPGSKQ